ncbi:hypothetical protein GOP47_0028201 [Adiantum capillus-veneris]|nr:hypothetical protein GOP47_0028201 [Adiantum capillus-veneris]
MGRMGDGLVAELMIVGSLMIVLGLLGLFGGVLGAAASVYEFQGPCGGHEEEPDVIERAVGGMLIRQIELCGRGEGFTVAPAVASAGSGTPAPDWALASSSLQQQQPEPPSSNSSSAAASRSLKERDFSLGFNGGSSDKFPPPFDSSRSSLGYGYSFDPSPSDQLPLGTILPVPPSLNLATQAPLFGTPTRFVGLANPDPTYARHFNISRSSNEDQLLNFYGQRLPFRTRDDDAAAARASFVSYEVQAQAQARLQAASRDQAEEEAAAASAHESLQLPGLRRAEEAGSSKGRSVSIVSPTAGEGGQHPWAVNILSRAKGSDSEQRGGAGANESEAAGGGGNNEGNATASISVADMELLGSRGAQEAEQAQMQQMMQLQQQQHQAQAQQQRAMQAEPILMRQRSSSSATIACQDCGNQAKKDCVHSRCRTCCKSRGYECATHVRSTWVPAAKRRERQQAELAALMAGQPVPKSKRARTLALAGAAAHFGHHHHPHAGASSFTSASTGTPPRTTSDFNAAVLPISLQQESMFRAALPREVTIHDAVFQCVRLTGISDGQDEYAYRTVVKIGGRIFKGLLHDQGSLDRVNVSSANVPELQLGGGRSAPLSSALIDLAGIYGTPGNTLLGKETMQGPF